MSNMIVKPGGPILIPVPKKDKKIERAQQQLSAMVREILWMRGLMARLAAKSPGGILTIDTSQPEPIGNVEVIPLVDGEVTFKFTPTENKAPLVDPKGEPFIALKSCNPGGCSNGGSCCG